MSCVEHVVGLKGIKKVIMNDENVEDIISEGERILHGFEVVVDNLIDDIESSKSVKHSCFKCSRKPTWEEKRNLWLCVRHHPEHIAILELINNVRNTIAETRNQL